MLAKFKGSFDKIPDYASKKFLLAVSGGIDSMVLVSLFDELKLNYSIAHCNFKLRKGEADQDQEFVKEIAEQNQVEFHTIDFDTLRYKKEKGLSTQMAARELRYDWFQKLRTEKVCDFIVTAHHLDDNVETVLLNLTRGTGIDGVTGMKRISNFIFRPLLQIKKEKIRKYAQENQVEFREDHSNDSNDYKRNKIRNQLIPLFLEMNPSFTETMGQNISHFNAVNSIYTKSVEKQLSDFVITAKGADYFVSIEKIKNHQQLAYEFLKRFQFNYSQVSQLISSLKTNGGSGKYYYSPSHQLLVDRTDLLITPNFDKKDEVVSIEKGENFVTYPINLTFNEVKKAEKAKLTKPNFAYLDLAKLKFPLKLRTWKSGDSFVPFGMVGKKKISDYLIDKKISRVEKEKTYVLISGKEIIWVVGHRVSENYKISDTTKTVLNIILE
ncbi:MAG: tRNA lysidine(34) synthetase TilS [Flavobacteriales bacterium]